MKKDTVNKAAVLALSTAIISGAANFINKFAVASMKNPVLFTTLKNSLVAIFLMGIVIAVGRFREIRLLSRSQWIRLFAIGAIGGSLPFALFFTGLSQTSAINGALIHKTLFLWVAFLAIPFLKEKIVWQEWLGIAAIFAGNLFVGGFTGFKFNIGEAMILAATILWAVENVIAKKALADISSTTVGAARMVIGSALLMGYVVLLGDISPVFALTKVQWGWTLLTAVFLTSYVLTWYAALKRASATFVAALLVPATLVTNILSAVFITHTVAGRDLASASLYSLGVFLVVFFAHRTAKKAGLVEDNKSFSANA